MTLKDVQVAFERGAWRSYFIPGRYGRHIDDFTNRRQRTRLMDKPTLDAVRKSLLDTEPVYRCRACGLEYRTPPELGMHQQVCNVIWALGTRKDRASPGQCDLVEEPTEEVRVKPDRKRVVG